jgi:hypothetical protein
VILSELDLPSPNPPAVALMCAMRAAGAIDHRQGRISGVVGHFPFCRCADVSHRSRQEAGSDVSLGITEVIAAGLRPRVDHAERTRMDCRDVGRLQPPVPRWRRRDKADLDDLLASAGTDDDPALGGT